MSKKMELKKETLTEWLDDTWNLYASQMFSGKLLRMHINGNGVYRIVHGEAVLYQGIDIDVAINTWNHEIGGMGYER